MNIYQGRADEIARNARMRHLGLELGVILSSTVLALICRQSVDIIERKRHTMRVSSECFPAGVKTTTIL